MGAERLCWRLVLPGPEVEKHSSSDLGALGERKRILDVYAKIPHSAFDLGVTEQDLYGALR